MIPITVGAVLLASAAYAFGTMSLNDRDHRYAAVAMLDVRPGQERRFEQIMRTNVELSRREPGVAYYDLFRATDDKRVYVNVEVYRDEVAFQAHLRAPFVQQTMTDFKDVLIGPPAVRTFERSE